MSDANPYSARLDTDLVHARHGGIALSGEREPNGYRMRLRVVEEYDVACWSENRWYQAAYPELK